MRVWGMVAVGDDVPMRWVQLGAKEPGLGAWSLELGI